MHLHNLAALLITDAGVNWPATAAIVAVVGGIGSMVAAVFIAVWIKPLIDKGNDDIIAKVVSKEIFALYVKQDEREHMEMREQLKEISSRIHSHGGLID